MEPLTPADKGRSFLVRWRNLQESPEEGLRPLRIGLCSTFTLEPLVPYLGCFLAQRGLLARFALAPYGQLYPALLDPVSTFAGEVDLTIALVRLEELCPRPLLAMDRLDGAAALEGRAACRAEVGRLTDAVRAHERRGGGQLLIGNLPSAPFPPLGPLDAGHPASRGQLVRELNVLLFQGLQEGSARLFDLDGVIARHGAARAYDDRLYYLSRCPFSDEFLRSLAEALSRAIAPLYIAPAKVLVLDLDHTLWGGIVGEDGPTGIELGDSGLGAAFVAFQEALLSLRAQGLLLCLASKNNETDAFEVIDRHPAMRLRRAHVTAHRIGWQEKTTSLKELAAELQLGLESFVFVDDNPAECEAVRQLLPQVTVLALPKDPAHYVAALRALPALDRMGLTAEDQRRADRYAEERARRAAGAGAEQDGAAMVAYLRSLELRLAVRPARAADIPRIAQLTQKTNQFNLTALRRSEADIEHLLSNGCTRILVADVSDRFGDYGTTGLLIAQQAPVAGDWEIDTLLLSCRVLGRGVEAGLLRVLLDELEGRGAVRLRGRFVRTAKNEPARGFFPAHGFRSEGEGRYLLEPLSAAMVSMATALSHLTIEKDDRTQP